MTQSDEHLRPIDFHALVDGKGPDGGLAGPERLKRLQQHVDGCRKCEEELGAYRRADASLAAVFGPDGPEAMSESDRDFIASLKSAQPEWQRAIADQLRRSPPNRWRVYAALAAAFLALAIGLGLMLRSRERRVDGLLAQAYTDSRPMEFRLPDKGYRPVSRTRGAPGGLFSQPPSLREAAGEIDGARRSRGATPALNRQQAEVELLQLNYAAVLDLLDHNDPQNAMLLAGAYFLKAEAQPEGGSADYARALDLIEGIRQRDPADLIPLFNLALTRERLHDLDGARKAWREYLARDASSGYAEEAKGHLAELEKKSELRRRVLQALGADAEKYLALAGRESIPAELFLDTALTKWLPRPDDPRAMLAATELAQALLDQVADPMLSEMAGSNLPRHAVGELAQAIQLDRSGDPLGGLKLAGEAQAEFEAQRQNAAALRAGFERVFALHRSLQTQACMEEAGRLESRLAGTSYLWLIAQNRIEKSVCRALRGEMQEAIELAESAASMAAGAHLPSTAMRARGMLSGDLVQLGNLRGSMELAAAGMEEYWSDGYPFNYAHQFFGDLSEACGRMGFRQAAYVFRQAAVDALMQTGELLLQAGNWNILGIAAGRAGRKAEAAEAAARSQALFERAPETRLKQNYLLDATMQRAASAVNAGEPSRSLELLNSVPPEKLASDIGQLRYLEARAMAYWKLGDVEQARASALAVVHRNWLTGEALLSPADRMQAVERQSQAYRLLTEIALRTDQDPYSAFVLWQAYRARQATRRPIDFEPVAGVAARDRVTKWSRGLPNETFVSLARLPEGLVVWLLDDERFECRRLQATPEWAAAQIESLVRKCADSASDPSAVETEAKALADALFEPIRPYLRSGRTLVVDADASLARAPFAVLFAAEQAPLVRSAGLVEYFMRSATPALQPSHSSLGLAYAPSLTPAWERLYPPLPDAAQEADEVSRGFGRVVRLQGAALTPTAFSRLFASTEVVHFAGHGSGDSGDGALLLSPEVAGRPFSGLLTSSQMARQDAQRCQIAVLSACSTGAGEENGPVNPESLVRVLLNSGARRVVASQWNVDSASTRRLMASFYRRMNEGSFPAQALADAAAEIRADPRKRHPYYWASFQMFGYR